MSNSDRVTGQVKWFNRQTGWGFITLLDDTNEDIFAHWRSLNIENEQFKYLVAGEYVELDIKLDESNKTHPKTADNVTGICGGTLMCQVRQTFKNDTEQRRTVGDIVLQQ
jgi:cold shock protein